MQVAAGTSAAAVLPLTLKLQGCADAGVCYPPTKWNTEVRYAPGNAGAATTPAPAAAATDLLAAAEQRRDSGGALAAVLGKGDAAGPSAASDPLRLRAPPA